MTEDERLSKHKEFRKYLRTRQSITGNQLNAVMLAAEEYLPELVRTYFMPSFEGLYEEQLDLRELLLLAGRIKRNENVLAGPQGFACWTATMGYAKYFAEKNGLRIEDYEPQESDFHQQEDDVEDLYEGSEYEARGIRYERDRHARKLCLNKYGYRCQICKMSFEEVYGDVGKDFIEVHHLVPISERGGNYQVNPYRDLIPLCSNCHAMVHVGMKKGVSIEDLKERFNSQ